MKLMIGLLLLLSTNLYAQLSETVAEVIPTLYCPPVSQLSHEAMTDTWVAPNGWKSDDQSFVNQIDHFLGAQWVGIEVGQVICLYAGVEHNTFPVLLYFNKLVLEPEGEAWGKNEGGYKNCKSADQKACPFQPKVKAPENNYYEEAAEIK